MIDRTHRVTSCATMPAAEAGPVDRLLSAEAGL